MPTSAGELLDANLHRVFGERDPELRHTAARSTYTDDVLSPTPRKP